MSAKSEFLVWGSNQSNLLSTSSTKSFNQPHPFHLPYDVISICASEKHVSFVTSNGSLYSYGSNLDGRLGVSTRTARQKTFQQPVKVAVSGKVIRVESGFSHMCALMDNGSLFAWGLGDYGALGTGEFKSCSTPTKVKLPTKAISTLRQISCGAMHTAFLTEDGKLYMCGSNEYGQLGLVRPQKISAPTQINFQLPIRQVSCGVFYTLILTKDGRVYGMGNNKYGQLGIGTKNNEYQPTLIRQLEGIVKVTAGYHSGAIDRYGNLFIWGSGSFGEFLKPRKYVLSAPIKDIAVRGFFGLAIGQNSKNLTHVYAWGNNSQGQLANDSYESSKEPTQIQALRGVQIGKITLGVNFAMLMLTDSHSHRSKSAKKVTAKSQRSISPLDASRYPSQRRDVASFEQDYLKSYQRKNNDKTVSPLSHNHHDQRMMSRGSQDYRRLFLNLSDDYEVMMRKYTILEKELSKVDNFSDRENDNLVLKQENTHLKRQVAYLNDELKNTMIKLADAEVNNKGQYSADLQSEYNKLLNQKEQIINRLNITSSRAQQQFEVTFKTLQEQHRRIEQSQQRMICEQKQVIQKLQTDFLRQKNNISEKQLLKEKYLKSEEEKDFIIQKNEEERKLMNERLMKSEEEKNKLSLLNLEMSDALNQTQRINELAKNLKSKNDLMEDKMVKMQVELGYELQFNKKYNDSFIELQQQRQRLNSEIKNQKQLTKMQKNKNEELQIEVEKGRKYKKESDLKNIQIQEFQEKFDTLKKKTDNLLRQKENQIIQSQETLHRKTKQFEHQLTNKVNELSQIHETNKSLQRQYNAAKDSLSLTKHQMNLIRDQNQVTLQQKAALQKKLMYVTAELNKEIDERQGIVREMGQVKRDLSKMTMVKAELEKNLLLERDEREKVLKKLQAREQELNELEDELDKVNEKCENLRKQNTINRQALQDANTRLQYQTKVNNELSQANKQFAQNQQQFNHKISELQRIVHELQDQNKSYAPRYDALMIRNRQLDERNRELGQMVNKAIEIQAQSYKNNILKQVQFNTDKIINQAKEQQSFISKDKRKKLQSKELTPQPQPFYQTPGIQSVTKEQPYTKLMKQRISQHKRRVSESAHKLANILDMEDTQNRGGRTSRATEDYEKINSQMEDFNNQKKNFMAKINSFAQKMKIL